MNNVVSEFPETALFFLPNNQKMRYFLAKLFMVLKSLSIRKLRSCANEAIM